VSLYSTFGKYKCRACIESSPLRGRGHSGMIYHPEVSVLDYPSKDLSLHLEKVPKSHPLYVKWFVEHYPQSKGIVGRQLNYLIYYEGLPIGIIGVSSPPLKFKPFREFFQGQSEKGYLNNNVFRIVNKPNDNNIGTKVLKLLRCAVKQDYLEKYGDKLVGLVTFVEPPRTGAVYRADNWVFLGITQGVHVTRRGESWLNKTFSLGQQKLIFARMI
jgi:hypothetical protein